MRSSEKQETIVASGLELRLRHCQKEDNGFVYELMRHCLEEPFNQWLPEKWSRTKFKRTFNPERIIIIEHDGMPIGFFDVEMSSPEAYFHNLQFSHDYQGKGLGTALAQYIEKKALEAGIQSIKGKIFKSCKNHFMLTKIRYHIAGEIPEENSCWIRKYLGGQNAH